LSDIPHNYVVVTIALIGPQMDNPKIHVYGPYARNEANRMANQLRTGSVITYARKLLPANEVTARPLTPKGAVA